MNKEVLRALFLEKRKTLSSVEFQKRNDLLFQHVTQFIQENKAAYHFHIFLSIQRHVEPDTWPIFRYLLHAKKNVYLSKTHFKRKQLIHYKTDNEDHIVVSKFGIPEPSSGVKASPSLFDIVFVPLISFDTLGNRIGYGAGLYDRFLSETREDCLKVGVAITPPLDNIDYTNAYDVKIDYCISHLGIDKLK